MILEHTPTPWHVVEHGVQRGIGHSGSDFQIVALTSQGNDEANAAFIVEACNAYERLRAALMKYGAHLANCTINDEARMWCDCGWLEVLDRLLAVKNAP